MATTNTNKGKNSKATAAGQLIAGVKKHFPNGSQQITVGGVSMTVDAVTGQLQAMVSNRAAVVAAQATAKTKVNAETAQRPALNAFFDEFVAFLRVTFGAQADVLADFGVKPPKAKTPMTAEQKAVAAAKRLATRAARGTKGPKAIQEVKGNVTATLVVTPVTTAATEASPTAPAPAPAPATPSGASTTQPHS